MTQLEQRVRAMRPDAQQQFLAFLEAKPAGRARRQAN